MNRVLAIDVGAGTQDILLYDAQKTIENCVKMVLPSQTVVLAERIMGATRTGRAVFLTGNVMGGGPLSSAVKQHIKAGLRVFATPRAAKSIRDNLQEVENLGVQIVDHPPDEAISLTTQDVDLNALRKALALFDVTLPDRYAIAVQDHGESAGISQRRLRFKYWADFVKNGGLLKNLVYADHPPAHLSRMGAVLMDVPGALLMDTAAAAVVGTLCDERVATHRAEGLVIVNIGNQHTLGVLCQGERIWGVFEHHTVLMDSDKLERYVRQLRDGVLSNDEVYEDNGHGACIDPGYRALRSGNASAFRFVTVTGPNRHMARNLNYYFATPHGDMMLSGCFGLVTAARWLGWVS